MIHSKNKIKKNVLIRARALAALSPSATFLVGGAVRDILRQQEPQDLDFVVTGSNQEKMIQAGFEQVGKDFPVFLHPGTGDEFALARRERKTGEGYTGFSTETYGVTLEEDLSRRDFTINAMAMELHTGKVVDPFDGLLDLILHKVVRHVGPAFTEDPLRVVRAARFAATLGLTIHPETLALCRENAPRLIEIPGERLLKEFEKAHKGGQFSTFIQKLDEVGALDVILPEVAALKGVPQPKKHHPEGDAFKHTLLCVKYADGRGNGAAFDQSAFDLSMAMLCHDLGKALTPEDMLPQHHGHEDAGVAPARAVLDRLRVRSKTQMHVMTAVKYHGKMHLMGQMNPGAIVRLILDIGTRRHKYMPDFMIEVALADTYGKLGDIDGAGLRIFQRAVDAFSELDRGAIAKSCKGPISEAIRQAEVLAVKAALKDYDGSLRRKA